MVSHWSLSDSKSPQVSRSLFSILASLKNVILWMVTIRPLISNSSSPCTNTFLTVPRAPMFSFSFNFNDGLQDSSQYFNNATVSIPSFRLTFSSYVFKLFHSLLSSLWGLFRRHQLQLVSPSMFHCFFDSLASSNIIIIIFCLFVMPPSITFLLTVEGDQNAPFSIATTPRCRGGRYSFHWIAPLYRRYVPYIAEC